MATTISEVEHNWDCDKHYIGNACSFVDSTIAKHLEVSDSKYSDVSLITKTTATRIDSLMHIPFQIHAEVMVAVPIIQYC